MAIEGIGSVEEAPRRSFEEVRDDILSGKWRHMPDVYTGGGVGQSGIIEIGPDKKWVRMIEMVWIPGITDGDGGHMDPNRILYVTEKLPPSKEDSPHPSETIRITQTKNAKGEVIRTTKERSRPDGSTLGALQESETMDGAGRVLKREAIGTRNRPKDGWTTYYFGDDGKESMRVEEVPKFNDRRMRTRFFSTGTDGTRNVETQDVDYTGGLKVLSRRDIHGEALPLGYERTAGGGGFIDMSRVGGGEELRLQHEIAISQGWEEGIDRGLNPVQQ
jgi:hypothetical protein